MDHATILTLNFRNMFTIIVMVTVGWFFLHLVGNLFNGTFSTTVSGNIGDGSASASSSYELGGGVSY